MTPVLIWTPQAREDLLDIYLFIGLDNPDAAERLYPAVQTQVELLSLYPCLGVPNGYCALRRDVDKGCVPCAV